MMKKKASVDMESQAGEKQGGKLLVKTTHLDDSKRFNFEIIGLGKLIEDKQMNVIRSPSFKFGGIDLSIHLYPDYKSSGYIAIYLHNESEKTLKGLFMSITGSLNLYLVDQEIKPGQGIGFNEFMSHWDYVWKALETDDVLKFEMSLTITEGKANIAFWHRLYILCFSFSANVNISVPLFT